VRLSTQQAAIIINFLHAKMYEIFSNKQKKKGRKAQEKKWIIYEFIEKSQLVNGGMLSGNNGCGKRRLYNAELKKYVVNPIYWIIIPIINDNQLCCVIFIPNPMKSVWKIELVKYYTVRNSQFNLLNA
jgi:hypothetical protein